MAKADVLQIKGKAICTFQDMQCLTPRLELHFIVDLLSMLFTRFNEATCKTNFCGICHFCHVLFDEFE